MLIFISNNNDHNLEDIKSNETNATKSNGHQPTKSNIVSSLKIRKNIVIY